MALTDPGNIGTLVRNWLHYDNLASSFYRQANRARQVRDDYEGKIIHTLSASNMTNAIIQIHGGQLQVVDEKNPRPLTLTRIEELLHAYYHTRPGKDETLEVMTFIRGHRGTDSVQKLRKSGMQNSPLPPLPAPPLSNPPSYR